MHHTPGSLKRLASELEDIVSLVADAIETTKSLDLAGIDQEIALIGIENLTAQQQELCTTLSRAACLVRTMAEGALFCKKTGGIKGVAEHFRVKHARSLFKLVAFLFVWCVAVACSSTTGDAGDEVGSVELDADACVDACTKFACEQGPAAGVVERCEASCEDRIVELDAEPEPCRIAWASLVECIAAAPCESYTAWLLSRWKGGDTGDPCDVERVEFLASCPGVAAP